MSTRSSRRISCKISGDVSFDYADQSPAPYALLKAELQLIAARYGLEIDFVIED